MFDLLIRGGRVVDGNGGPARRADVGVRGGRIVAIGGLAGSTAERTIDAAGRVVAPGFVDVHTHLDAQAFWDPTLSPSPLHGVTTVIGGNCGFTIAPLSDDSADAEYLMRMLARVEGMPLAALQAGVPWNWKTTAEYLDTLDGTLSINAAFKVGHSTIRRVVMGAAATRREATPEEIGWMCELLRAGLEAGAIGFSSSWSTTHNDGDQNMVPSRYATKQELLALCSVLADYPGSSVEFIPCVGAFDADAVNLMAEMSIAAKAPLNWNVLAVFARNRDECAEKLAASDVAAARGARVVDLTAPMSLDFRLSLASGFILDAIPGWEEIMLAPLEMKKAVFEQPDERARLGELAAGQHSVRRFTHWAKMAIFDTVNPENERFR